MLIAERIHLQTGGNSGARQFRCLETACERYEVDGGMGGRMDERMNGRMNGRMDGTMDGKYIEGCEGRVLEFTAINVLRPNTRHPGMEGCHSVWVSCEVQEKVHMSFSHHDQW